MGLSLGRRDFLRTALGGAGMCMLDWTSFTVAQDVAPPFPIVDTHLHLWDLKRFNLPWLSSAPEVINRGFSLDDFRIAAEGLGIAKTIYMEVDVHPAQQVQEAEFAIGLCEDKNSSVAGAVIGGYPHEKGFAEYLKRFVNSKWVKGVRTVLLAPDRPAALCLTHGFVDSMKRLGDQQMTFDLCMRPDELLTGVQLATKCPKTTFVLDHCGNIGAGAVAPARRQQWCDGIKAAASQPNVFCKISGLIDKANGVDWTAETLADNVNFCLDTFSEERVLFGGDWPVCHIGGGYKRWVEALKQIVQDRSGPFQRKLFHDNAAKLYRLA